MLRYSMENSEETPARRTFKDLNNPEKVRAMLGVVKEPVSKMLALDLSGIDYKSLKENEKEELNNVFLEDNIEAVDVEGESRYRLGEEARRSLDKTVDLSSAEDELIENLMTDSGLK